jgi:hypothetical protein
MKQTKWAPLQEAERTLQEFLKTYTHFAVPPVPVEVIADSHFGLLVNEAEIVRDNIPDPNFAARIKGPLSGLLLIDRKEIWVAQEESERSPGRKRFTIAHEIGHYVLQYLRPRSSAPRLFGHHEPNVSTRYACRVEDIEAPATSPMVADVKLEELIQARDEARRQRFEVEANYFAAELLMPAYLVKEVVRQHGTDLPLLARTFDVSLSAIRCRLLSLGVLKASDDQTQLRLL